jgi:hypothetical protein
MSPEAITRRLEEMRSLYKLMVYLRQFKVVGPVASTGRTNGSDR